MNLLANVSRRVGTTAVPGDRAADLARPGRGRWRGGQRHLPARIQQYRAPILPRVRLRENRGAERERSPARQGLGPLREVAQGDPAAGRHGACAAEHRREPGRRELPSGHGPLAPGLGVPRPVPLLDRKLLVPCLRQQEGRPAGYRASAAGHRNCRIHPPLTARMPSAVAAVRQAPPAAGRVSGDSVPGMDELTPRLRAVCDLDVAEMREYSGRHEYDGKIQDLSQDGVRRGLDRLAAATAGGPRLDDSHDETQLATFEEHARVSLGDLELHRRNPALHLAAMDLACYDRDYAPREQRDGALLAQLAAWPQAADAAVDALDQVSAPVATALD